METKDENNAMSKYLLALKNATSDNERFAALLMVAKVSKEDSCSIAVKRQILDTVGGKFFSRLLKTKNVPDGCPFTVYKSVAMSILSALCIDPDVACSPTLTENMSSFNDILRLDPDESDAEGRQLVTDTYECLNSLCQTKYGQQSMTTAGTVSALCDAITSQVYGHEKAQDLLLCLTSQFRADVWERCEDGFHAIVSHYSQQFLDEQSLRKFELCKTLVFLLTAVPKLEREGEPPWARKIVGGLDSILRSKVGKSQREPALRLASMLVQACGMGCLLPPDLPDNKLFLLTTHLCCVEVRMVLEDPELKQFQTSANAKLLSSCYSFLESVINYMTGGPTLSLDDRQVLQLHSAMVGAFSAIIQFLSRVSNDPNIQWSSIILATVRVLGAWLSEETSALKEEVYELIPFLIQISKLCIPPEQVIQPETSCSKQSQTAEDINETGNSTDKTLHPTHQVDRKCDSNGTSIKNGDLPVEFGKKGNTENAHTEDFEFKSDGKGCGDTNMVNSADNDVKENGDQNSCDSEKEAVQVEKDSESKDMEKEVVQEVTERSKPTKDNRTAVESKTSKQVTFKEDTGLESKFSEMEVDEHEIKMKAQVQQIVDITDLAADDSAQIVLTNKELSDLHLKADIFHYLLPALCHFTADDEPRQLLMDSGALTLLDLYMWRQWERFIATPTNREIQSSLLILCNIFLNFSIVDPAALMKHQEFSHILLLAVKGVDAMGLNEEYLGLWSHLVTLGLMLLRQLYQKTGEFLESESLTKFYGSCIRYLNGAYRVQRRKKGPVSLELAEEYQALWDQISQTWFLSMQALSACISLLPEIPATVLKSGWLPSAMKTLLEVKASTVGEDVRSCYLLLLITMARKDPAAKVIIKDKGGLEFSRAYRSKELQELLQGQ